MDKQKKNHINSNDNPAWDQQIKDKLAGHESITPAGAWEAFESFESRHQDTWDEQVKDKLSEASHQGESDWAAFQEKMLVWKKMRQEFLGLRIAEVAIVLLLLLAFYQADHLFDSVEPDATQTTAELGNINQTDQRASMTEMNETPTDKILENSSDISSGDSDEITSSEQDHGPNDNSHHTASESKKVKAESHYTHNLGVQEQGEVNNNIGVHEQSAFIISASDEKVEDDQMARGQAIDRKDIITILEQLKSGVNTLPSTEYSLDETPFKLLNEPWDDNYRRAPIWLSAYGIGAINRIRKPQSDSVEARTLYQPFAGAGLAIDFENGRWMLSSGLEYHRTDIKSGRSLLYGDVNTGIANVTFDKARIHFFTIPVLAKYSLVKNSCEQWFVSAGARLHMSSKVRHYFTTTWLPGPHSPDDLDEMALHNVSETNFNYFTINLGLGYQKVITPGTAIFASTTLELFGQNHSFFPRGEKLDALRLHFGVKQKI